MEPFSLLKFWRSSGSYADSLNINSPTNNTTNVDVRNRAPETDEDSDTDDDNDEDSFFDLVLTRAAPDRSGNKVVMLNRNTKSECDEHEGEEDSINNLIELESPLKAKVFPVDPNSKPQSPISLLKSAPKFRVFLLGFRKSKSDKSEANNQEEAPSKPTPKHQHKSSEIDHHEQKSKRFTVKCKVEEVSIGSLFSRDNSLRSKLQRERSIDFSTDDESTSKPLPKDHVPMYLKLIKPLYIRASKRYTTSDRIRSPTDQFSPSSSPATAPPTSPRKLSGERRGTRGAGFRVVGKHLGKSRSASSTVGVTSSPASRRDDSLLLQHDGIQSAILHCKRSYNSSAECSALLRASHGKSMNQAGNFNLPSDRNRCSSI